MPFMAVHAGHVNVPQHQVHRLLFQQLDGLNAPGGLPDYFHLGSPVGEQGFYCLAYKFMVVGNDESDHGISVSQAGAGTVRKIINGKWMRAVDEPLFFLPTGPFRRGSSPGSRILRGVGENR
jgi:hypothetical protein